MKEKLLLKEHLDEINILVMELINLDEETNIKILQ